MKTEPLDVMWAIGELADHPADDHMFREPELSEENQRRINWLFDENEHDLALAERPECHQEGTTYTSVYGRMYADQPAPTLTTGFLTPGRGRFVHPTQRRTLRPAEAARLQGFPDNYVFDPQQVPSTAKLVKWIGDAVPMPLGHIAGLSALVPDLFGQEGSISSASGPGYLARISRHHT
jgi:DNA (cytosine-5)-methyltransferase 1